MEKEKKYERLSIFMTAAVIAVISGIAVIGAAPGINAFLDPALAVGERGCIAYQTYPAQVSCPLTIAPTTFTSV
jgi:hypothetical protein